jgi:hypothetical protein
MQSPDDKCCHSLVGYQTEEQMLDMTPSAIHAASAQSTFNPNMGQVQYARSIVDGRDWTIEWHAPVSVNGGSVVSNSGYKYNLVGPKPKPISSLYDQVVTGATSVSIPQWLYEGIYEFTIWPYDATNGVGYPNTFVLSNIP